MKHHALLLLPLTICSASCGLLNTTYRTHDLHSDGSALIDVKQRAIIVGHRGGPSGDLVACAEPSPDAMSAYAAELAGKGNVSAEQSVELAGAARESSSFVGLRTQSIQLLRDQGYRLCEGYQSSALSRTQYDLLMRRHQKMMVSLLAIEQLTGVVRVPTIAVNADSNASTALTSLQIEQQIKASKEKSATLRKLHDEKAAAVDDTDEEAKLEVKALKGQLADEEQRQVGLERALVEAKGAQVTGSLTVNLLGTGERQRSDEHVALIAESVSEIVEDLVKPDDDADACLSTLTAPPEWLERPAVNEAQRSLIEKREAMLRESCARFFQRMQLKAVVKMRKDAVKDARKAKDALERSKDELEAVRSQPRPKIRSEREARAKDIEKSKRKVDADQRDLESAEREEQAFRDLTVRFVDAFQVTPALKE